MEVLTLEYLKSILNTTGLKGVSAGKDGKFRVYICLGTFSSKEEAKNVYDEAAKKIYGEFYRA